MNLPDIITLEEYGGDFKTYLDVIYSVFKVDFVDTKPTFEGKRLGLKKLPIVDGRECTFYHFTHEGKDESNRTPCLRRMERMPFPRPMIDNSRNQNLRVWRNKRGADNRILIFHEGENYLIVLADKGEYILPWTAYLVNYGNQKRKLLAEHESWAKMQKSPGNS